MLFKEFEDGCHGVSILIYSLCLIPYQSKKGDNDQEWIQSSTTLDPGYHMGK